MTALLLFVLGFQLYNLILYIFFLISSEKAVQESEGILMVCEVGRGGGGVMTKFAPLAWWFRGSFLKLLISYPIHRIEFKHLSISVA